MNKFYDQEKNLLENYPEIRDPSLRTTSLFDKWRWNYYYKHKSLKPLAVVLPATMVVITLSSCTPVIQVDEHQQQAYKNYLSAWSSYESAVSAYNTVENPDKPSLPANLVLTKTLDEKATTDNLKKETDTVKQTTANINELTQAYKNNDLQKASYQNYLTAWDAYTDAVVEYNMLENEEKPEDLPAELVLSKNLDENATTQQLNQERSALEQAITEINKLIKQYEQATPSPKPMTPKEIAEKVTSTVESNIKEGLENGASDIKYLAIDYKKVEDKHYLDILVEYQHPSVEKGTKSIRLLRVPMQSELNEENIKNGTFKPKNEWDAFTVVNISTTADDNRAEQTLAKLKEDNQVTYSDLTNVTSLTIGGSLPDATLGCGVTGVTISRVDSKKIISYTLMVKSDGNTKDMIGENLINGELGKTYRVVKQFEYEFGENAILLGEMFKTSEEYSDVDLEINGQRYAMIRNGHTVYSEDLDKIMREPESY